jgi:hypothetical protein
MTTKLPLKKILNGISHPDEENKNNHESAGNNKSHYMMR